ncbi:hypothetical protein [Paludibacterium sp.]|uniref:hypothetical protein n=1 Tax=Paludibacterium sp. TaxID=1917523 RepID=UPI0025DE5F6F|nr:hypothetical protein [Paludibacterium sp.]MBV8648098.1 hypothetical protein [Paludibacterium sp.]
MKTLTMMIALLTVSTAALAESHYIPRQTQAALAQAQATQNNTPAATDTTESNTQAVPVHSNYTRH